MSAQFPSINDGISSCCASVYMPLYTLINCPLDVFLESCFDAAVFVENINWPIAVTPKTIRELYLIMFKYANFVQLVRYLANFTVFVGWAVFTLVVTYNNLRVTSDYRSRPLGAG